MAQIEITGNAGSDVELKFIKGSKGDFAVANFSVAETPREFKNGEWVQGETIWWKVSATGELAESCTDYVLKGTKVFIRGELKPFEYKAKDGETKSGWEVRAKLVSVVAHIKKAPKVQKEEEASWPF